MKNNFYEELKKYFEVTPREKILEDWNKSSEFDNIGPTVEEFNKVIENKNKFMNKIPTAEDYKMKTIRFYKEINDRHRWYADIPEWTGEKWELEMIQGADTMLEMLSQGENEVKLTVSTDYFEGSDDLVFEGMEDGGAWYSIDKLNGMTYPVFELWLCHVIKIVFGDFPQTIFIKTFKKIENKKSFILVKNELENLLRKSIQFGWDDESLSKEEISGKYGFNSTGNHGDNVELYVESVISKL